jgi:hypothetical protein
MRRPAKPRNLRGFVFVGQPASKLEEVRLSAFE